MVLGIQKTFNLPDGREVVIETGKLAKQADGSVVVRCGNTVLLATVCSKTEVGENVDFMPLTVDYQEKYAALGRFPGGFFKREARLSEYEILISRLVDRALRPLFPGNYHADTQVLIYLISGDKDNLPDAFAALAASSALSVSDIPFNGPVSEVRVARVNGQFVINPTVSQMEEADLELMVGATLSDISMVEGEMKEVDEEVMIQALQAAHEAIKVQCQVQLELAKEAGKPKREYCHEVNDEQLKQLVREKCYQKCYDCARQCIADKKLRAQGIDAIKKAFIEENFTPETLEGKEFMIDRYFHDVHRDAVRDMILKERIRLDGRGLEDIRPIWCEVDVLPGPHGSAIFTRGETQSLSTCTLGSKLDEQIIDGAVVEGRNNFLLHYNFPPFATGEVKPVRGAGRREIGHGNLALRALKQVLPKGEENPYTIRVVSDILESNGSSSMATVCAGCLALMDAGVKISKPVSGIAMGLITDPETGNYAVLSDILGYQDRRPFLRDPGQGFGAGASRPGPYPGQDARSPSPAAGRLQAACASHRANSHSEGVYRGCHRNRRESHPGAAAGDRVRNLDRGRRRIRHRGCCREQQGKHGQGAGPYPCVVLLSRSGESLRRGGQILAAVRGFRGNPPGQGRLAPYFRNQLEPGGKSGRRA